MTLVELQDLYYYTLLVRRVEETVAKLNAIDMFKCAVHLCIGQEAASVGICRAVGPSSPVFSTHRNHGVYIAKGGSLVAFFAELLGRASGCSRGRGGSMHVAQVQVGILGTTSIVGGGIPIATGASLALIGSGRCSVALFGDGASEEGVLYESMNFAKLKSLPVLFARENNRLSVDTPIESRESSPNIMKGLADAFNLPYYETNGVGSVVEVYEKTREAIALLVSGKGPVVMEIPVTRWYEHAGSNKSYSNGSVLPEDLCPLLELTRNSQLSEGYKRYVEERVVKDIDVAYTEALSMPETNPAELLDYVY